MKIIGKTERDRVLVDASMAELCQLTGYPDNWYRERDGKAQLKPGDEIDVTTLFRHCDKMKEISNDLARARALVDGCSAGLTLADNLIKAAVQGPDVAGETA